jgi:IS30 family transposase
MRVLKPRLTAGERAELWQRWRSGQSLSDIGRALGKPPASVFGYLRSGGGISPAPRRRSPRALTPAEREEISRGLSTGASLRLIARRLSRPPSTVSREVTRNRGRIRYRAAQADERAWKQAHRPKICKLAQLERLQRVVAEKLQADWSPAQIAGWLREHFTDDSRMNISHETIYRSLFVQARGVLKKELLSHLRYRRKMRHSKNAAKENKPHGQIVGAISIRERPAEVEDRAIPGHWEGDLLCGGRNSYIATLVERHSRFTLLVRVKSKETETVVAAVTKHVNKLPLELRRSLTWDRGMEMAHHKAFSIATDVKVYFCDPQSPWQRGTNENTNGLLRQYFPHGTDLSLFSQATLNTVARRLNTRPRKTLGFKTPAATLHAALH